MLHTTVVLNIKEPRLSQTVVYRVTAICNLLRINPPVVGGYCYAGFELSVDKSVYLNADFIVWIRIIRMI